MNDTELVALFLQRDENAITITKRNYGSYSFSIALRILGSYEDAEECENDAYIALWNSIPPEEPKNMKAYLGRIIRNISLNRLKAQKAEKRNADITIPFSDLSECISSQNDIWKEIDRILLGEYISDWLKKEKKLDRVLFIRYYWFGEDYEKLMEEFRLTYNNLANKLFRMRKRLKKHLMKKGVEV